MIQNRIKLPRDWPTQDRPFFNRAAGRAFDIRAAEETTEINIYDEIGFWGITASEMRRVLDGVRTDKILVRVNSPGGDVFDGIAIHNDLEAHPAEVTVRVTGIAASAASLIAMAGDRVEMFDNAFLMIHNAWGFSIGDKGQMRRFADVLEEIDAALAATYSNRTGKPTDEIAGLMDAETWLNGASAVEESFADEVVSGGDQAQARFDLSGFRNAPQQWRRDQAKQPSTKRDLERGLRDAGYSRSMARDLVNRVYGDGTGHAEPLRDAGATDLETVAAFERLIDVMAA